MVPSFPTTSRALLVVLLGGLILSCLSYLAPAQQPKRILAPELDGGVGWIGTDKPIQLKDLRGKFVVFDFWTLC